MAAKGASALRLKLKLKAVIECNKEKAGIDLFDQTGTYASVLHKSTKWCRKLAFELLLVVAAVNAHDIFEKHNQISTRKFGEKVDNISAGIAL